MRGIYKYVCYNRCRAEENLRCPEHSEGNGVVLKFAANRSRQLGEVCARLLFSACKKICAHSRKCYFSILQKICQTFKTMFF